MTLPWELVSFDAGTQPDAVQATELARLHAALLPHSPVAMLGTRFMTQFYYRDLFRAGSIFGALAYVGREPVAMVISTDDANGFMRRAVRKLWPRLTWVLATSVLTDPRRIRGIWYALRIMWRAPAPAAAPRTGEILTMGVLPAGRMLRDGQGRPLNLAHTLLEAVVAGLRARGVHTCRVIVDSDNLPARLLYTGSGWSPGLSRVPGWHVPSCELVRDLT